MVIEKLCEEHLVQLDFSSTHRRECVDFLITGSVPHGKVYFVRTEVRGEFNIHGVCIFLSVRVNLKYKLPWGTLYSLFFMGLIYFLLVWTKIVTWNWPENWFHKCLQKLFVKSSTNWPKFEIMQLSAFISVTNPQRTCLIKMLVKQRPENFIVK